MLLAEEPRTEEAGQTCAPEEAARAGVYALLARLLVRPPDQALLERLCAIAPNAVADEASLAPAWAQLRLAALGADLAALDDEFHDLFIGLGRGEVVPYGSWYLTGFMMDRPLAELRRDLAVLGFERQAEVREPEDHVCALCDVMALLAGEGAALEVQRRFYAVHLAPWLELFFKDLQQARAAQFYRAVGLLGERFCAWECRYLGLPASGARGEARVGSMQAVRRT